MTKKEPADLPAGNYEWVDDDGVVRLRATVNGDGYRTTWVPIAIWGESTAHKEGHTQFKLMP